ncbi:MAG: FAD-binding protein [Roseibium sp.]|uniref:FAD-binding PCMH-type domain-containing protein n=2 Tax=Alphaproteobacteria TaxID=28211 RepID=A0A2G8REM4_9RHOB|nr:hypothetical protein P775_11550 [Puniceibacterium antarcticum]
MKMNRLQTEDAIAAAIKDASGPLRILGGGTRPVGRPVTAEALSVAGLSGITLYEPGALTLVAKAGTPLAEIEDALTVANQRLAFEPQDFRAVLGTTGTPTIGGIVAGNVSGPRRIAVGACRDFLLGVRFVDGSGQIIKNGGRVMKNVTGYDLVKLMCGSYGTLGALTEVSLKVLPNVEAAATLRFVDLDMPESITLMSNALGSPFEVTGAARCGTDTLLRIEGFTGSVAYRADMLQSRLKLFGSADLITDAQTHAKIWLNIRDMTEFAEHDALWRVSLRPSHAAAFIQMMQQMHSFDYALDWGGGLVWAAAKTGTGDLEALHTELQHNASLMKGHCTLIKGSDALRTTLPAFQPEHPSIAAITAGLRAKFDPRGILNPGMMT